MALLATSLCAMEGRSSAEGQVAPTQYAGALPVIDNKSGQELRTQTAVINGGVVFTVSKTKEAPLLVVLYAKERNGHEYPLATVPFERAGFIQIPIQFLMPSRISFFRAHVSAK